MEESNQTSPGTLGSGFRIAGRYRIGRMLGRGGSATVYAATDEQVGSQVALKHLLASADSSQHALFQREYYTLAQITHPGVIRVFDYGVTPDGPFYTMELLDERDLSQRAPLPWRETCRVLREVASALAILHSRRLIHRDVSHRNVGMTSDGRAKLIDFGAMAPMGFVPHVIGTPPFVSPEAADGELLDQRVDLYALGALGHFLLAGRHLYPAKTVRQLRKMWTEGREPAFADDTPAALAQLLMALVQRDPMARPASAAEVIDRLSAIADLPAVDDLTIARSYLTNPKLIGRQAELQLLEVELDRARVAGRNTTLVVCGSYGTGKSRLLQEVVIQAKFAGFTVLQAAAHEAGQQPFAVIARLVTELLRKLPDAVADLPPDRAQVMSWAIPGLLARGPRPAEPAAPGQELRARAQVELSAFLRALGAREWLLLAIDDLHACDEESLAVLLPLAEQGERGPAIIGTMHDGASAREGPRRIASRAARRVDLRPFDRAETERLVESLFGSSPSSQRVSGWMQEHAHGNPLECMELARYLVDRRAAHYMEGAWMLPHELPAGVPRGLADAFRARVAALDPKQRAVAELLALHGRPAPLSLCIELSAEADQAELFSALNQLVSAELLFVRGDRYGVSREGLREALLRGLSPHRRGELHQRIGEALAAGGLPDAAAKLEAGHHLLRGQERGRGVELVEQAALPEAQGVLSTLGEAVVPTLELALEVAEAEGLSPARCMRLRARLAMCAYLYDKKLVAYAEPLLDRLREDSGLGFLASIEPGNDGQRLARALELAQARYDRTPPARRGLPPLEALLELGPVVGSTLGVAIFGYDAALIARLADVVAPFAELDKRHGLAVIYDLVVVVHELIQGRLARGHRLRRELLARLRDPSMYAGMSEGDRKTILATQLHALGMREAAWHSGRAFSIADEIDSLGMKMYVGAAQQIRLIAHLYRGDVDAAKVCQLRLDSASLQGGAGRQTEIWLLGYLVAPYALWADVIALKRTAERLGALVPDNPGYRQHVHIALGAYYRVRGQLDEAKSALSHAVRLAGQRMTVQWALAMTQYIETLVAAGQWAQAVELAAEHFGPVEPDETEQAAAMQQLLPVLSIAKARLGQVEAAARELEQAIAAAQADDRPLAFCGKLYEARARVALLAGDRAGFERCAAQAGALYRSVNNSVLLLGHLALLDEGRRLGFVAHEPRSAEDDLGVSMPTVHERGPASIGLADVESETERWQRALALLLGCTEAVGGLLLVSGPAGFRIAACSAGEGLPDGLFAFADSLVATAACSETERTAAEGQAWTSPQGERYHLLPLAVSSVAGTAVVGVAALRFAPGARMRALSPTFSSAVARALQEAAEFGTERSFEGWMAF